VGVDIPGLTDVVTALAAVTAADPAGAISAARQAGAAGSPLGTALADHLSGVTSGRVYDQPAAFEAFIRGGGNVALYRATSAALAAQYERVAPARLLDLGCGDGLALLPALAAYGRWPDEVTLLEPSPKLLATAWAAAIAAAPAGTIVSTVNASAQDFLARPRPSAPLWDVIESTFALHALEVGERDDVLRRLALATDTLVIVEFDVPSFIAGSTEQLHYLATHYERGLAEYADTPEGTLVNSGFLLPVLVGQLAPGAVRSTWEQPASAWVAQVERAGFTEVAVERVADYWWAPAFVLTARGHPAP
jgi:SAM-dependent methyltransferase